LGRLSRRHFIGAGIAGCAVLGLPRCASVAKPAKKGVSGDNKRGTRILFSSRGKVGLIDADGGVPRYLDFDVPGQVSWHIGPLFSDGQRFVLMSVEGLKTWEHNVRSHLWIHDPATGVLTEIAARNRPAEYMPACSLLPGEKRIVVNPIIDGEQRIMTMNLDGSDAAEVTHAGEGFCYGVDLSPDGARLAFHASGPEGYRVFVTDLEGSRRTLVAAHPDHLYFGPTWSLDGEWLLYADCMHKTDPGHDWADLCIGRPDGSEHRVVTHGQRHWFGTSYGGPETRGSGSNISRWSPQKPRCHSERDPRNAPSVCTYTRALPNSRTAWPYAVGRPDTDHFNRDYRPEEAHGGTEICILDPFTGGVTPITGSTPPVWDFRAAWSPDGNRVAFCRSAVGCPAELWAMNADGAEPRFLTRGYNDLGADHPVWL